MAYTKIKPIKSNVHLQSAVNYITREDKTDGKTNIYTYMCNVENAVLHFRNVRNNAIQKGNNVAHHICLSFSPEDKINPETAIEIGQTLMREMYPNNQYILSVHNDREHLHCHIIVNLVDMKKHRKINSNIKSLNKMRSISDQLCEEYGLSIILPEHKIQRQKLKTAIDNAVENSNNFEEFLLNMKNKRYDIKAGKHLAFKSIGNEKFIRCESIGTAYTEKQLRDRIVNKTISENKHKNIYDDKIKHNTKRYSLKRYIDTAIQESKSFDEFLSFMRDNDYCVKQGKYLAFKHKGDNRFIRVKSIGEDYTEEIIKFRIENPEEYKLLIEKRRKEEVGRLIKKDNIYSNRYINTANIDIQIRSLNYLTHNNIESYNDLIMEIEKSKQREQSVTKTLNDTNMRISKINDILNAYKTCYKYRYIAEEYEKTNNKEEYRYKHSKELKSYDVARVILEMAENRNEKQSVPDLNEQLDRLKTQKTAAEKRLIQVKDKIKNLENIKYNLENSENNLTDKSAQKEHTIPHRTPNYRLR